MKKEGCCNESGKTLHREARRNKGREDSRLVIANSIDLLCGFQFLRYRLILFPSAFYEGFEYPVEKTEDRGDRQEAEETPFDVQRRNIGGNPAHDLLGDPQKDHVHDNRGNDVREDAEGKRDNDKDRPQQEIEDRNDDPDHDDCRNSSRDDDVFRNKPGQKPH